MHTRIKLLMLPAFTAALFAAPRAFAQKTPPPPPPAVQPPQPPKPPNITDFEDARKELDKAAADLEKSTKDFTLPELPAPPAPPQIDRSEIEKALKEIDVAKIRADVEKSLKDLDTQKIRQEVDAALAKVDMAAIRKEVEASLKKMEVDLVAQKEAVAKMNEELKTIRPKVEADLKKAQADITRAKEELSAYEAFVNSLAADGLLDKKAYAIEHKEGKLYINGKEQPEWVYNKHRSFLEKQKGLKITKNENGLNIQKD